MEQEDLSEALLAVHPELDLAEATLGNCAFVVCVCAACGEGDRHSNAAAAFGTSPLVLLGQRHLRSVLDSPPAQGLSSTNSGSASETPGPHFDSPKAQSDGAPPGQCGWCSVDVLGVLTAPHVLTNVQGCGFP